MATTAASHRLQVLVVDDDPDTLWSTASLLQLYGADVQTANDGTAAIEQARSSSFDVVLLDVAMPRRDGFSTARVLRRLASQNESLVDCNN
jgi:CheY-like chemotaxis protein